MGVRVGGGIGPVGVSAGVGSREASGCLTIVAYAVVATLVLAIVVFVLPPIAVLACAFMWATRSRSGWSGGQLATVTMVAAVGVGIAAWAWPAMYTSHRYGVDVPRSSFSDSVGDYRERLATAGFEDIEVVRKDDPGSGRLPTSVTGCSLESVSPEEGERADIRRPVIITARCIPVERG